LEGDNVEETNRASAGSDLTADQVRELAGSVLAHIEPRGGKKGKSD
jgi:hypothetical protein